MSDGEAKLAKLLLEKGADINYHKPDMVFPYASTPVTEAARSNDFPMVRWLVEQGADITTVSYTHLDVYKRQMLLFPYAMPCGGWLAGKRSAIHWRST